MHPGEFRRRAACLFRRDRLTRDLQEEIRLHIELRARRLEEQGMAREEALFMAQRQFGNRTIIQDSSSELWGGSA
jgi:hypothetical protein